MTDADVSKRAQADGLVPDDLRHAEMLRAAYQEITGELGRLIVGQQEVIEQVLIAVLARGLPYKLGLVAAALAGIVVGMVSEKR